MSTPAYLFDLGGRQLLYSPLAGLAAVLSRRDCERLLSGTQVRGELARLRELLQQEPVQPSAASGDLSPEIVGLVTTRSCNMACSYCEFGAGRNEDSSLDTEVAFSAVEEMGRLAKEHGRQKLKVHFFGGEPFQEWQLIRLVVERTRAVAEELALQPFFEATTNGLYPAAQARWIADNLHRVVLSLDGLPAVHDAARRDRQGRPTSGRVEQSATIFSSGTVELNLRLCVSAAGVAQVPESITYLVQDKELRPATIALEPVRSLVAKPPPAALERPMSPPSPADFVQAFMSSLDTCEERGVLLLFSGADLGANVASFCPVGRDGFIVHSDGLVASCYLPRDVWRRRGLTIDYGRIVPERGLVVDDQRLQAARKLVVDAYPECRDCFCRWHCAGGCHVYRAGRKNDPDWCTIVRAISIQLLLRQVGAEDSPVPSLKVCEQPVRLAPGTSS
jgi:uncharacterized protein